MLSCRGSVACGPQGTFERPGSRHSRASGRWCVRRDPAERRKRCAASVSRSSEGCHAGQRNLPEVAVRGRVLQKVGDFARREVTVALPAAKRAVRHGVQAFLKKFSEEYAKERKKL
jgi:hypothetical protein